VSFGKDFTLKEYPDCYHAVIFATGAAADRKLGIPGEDIQGSHAATSFVGWYNGHPDYRDLEFDLSSESAIVIGQGNVAIDVCRILAKSVDELRKTDIASHALDVLAESRIREIHLIGRRGPVQARFTTNDLLVGDTCKSELTDVREPARQRNFEIFRSFASRQQEKRKSCRIHFFLSPREAHGTHRLEELVLERTRLVGAAGRQEAIGTGQTLSIKAGLMIRSVGYSGLALEGVPFDEKLGTIPNKDGRAEATSPDGFPVYVTGWIKRGPTGIIGTNRADSMATVATLLADLPNFNSQHKPGREASVSLLAQRSVQSVSFPDWEMIDQAERARGLPFGKPREKFTRISEMLAASSA
jgi:ferredoxin--NADP+ reductase